MLALIQDYLYALAKAERVLATRTRYFASIISQVRNLPELLVGPPNDIVQPQDLGFHDANRSTELAQRLMADPEAMDDFVLYTLVSSFTTVVTGCA